MDKEKGEAGKRERVNVKMRFRERGKWYNELVFCQGSTRGRIRGKGAEMNIKIYITVNEKLKKEEKTEEFRV